MPGAKPSLRSAVCGRDSEAHAFQISGQVHCHCRGGAGCERGHRGLGGHPFGACQRQPDRSAFRAPGRPSCVATCPTLEMQVQAHLSRYRAIHIRTAQLEGPRIPIRARPRAGERLRVWGDLNLSEDNVVCRTGR